MCSAVNILYSDVFCIMAIKDKQTLRDNTDLWGNEHVSIISVAQIEQRLSGFVSFTDPLPFHRALHVCIKHS